MRIKTSTKYNLLLLAFCLFFGLQAFAQQQTPLDNALRYLENNAAAWDLTTEDISDVGVSDLVFTKHNGVTHVYLNQRYNGLDIYRALVNIAIAPDGNLYNVGHRFISNVADKVVSTSASLDAAEAITTAANKLGIAMNESPELKEKTREGLYIFHQGNYAKQPVRARLNLMPTEDGRLMSAWHVLFDVKGSNDFWSLQIDAVSGEILDKQNFTVECKLHKGMYHNHDATCREKNANADIHGSIAVKNALTTINGLAGSYRVFAMPDESPIHGSHQLVADPADPIASPFGWHDVNGSDGAEYTITRGNNTWAYLDPDDLDASSGDEPDGGTDLIFDFPYDSNVEPDVNGESAVVNLFYWANIIHDFSYRYGFDEAGGNFQQNNYGNGGIGGDALIAEAQDGFNTGSSDNAFYSGGPDGTNAGVHMFAWTVGDDNLLHVNAPSSVVGSIETGTATWGLQLTQTDTIRGEVEIVNDDISSPLVTDGCEDITNASEIAGKIALIDRGGCEFGLKARNAEDAGAIGVIICNFEDALINMAPGAVGASVTIPVLFVSSVDCATIRQFAGSGLDVTFKQLPPPPGPAFLDGDFDNGIIAHEIGHGISGRMIGGPNQGGCLGGESASEGISDLMSLITTVKAGDTGEMKRGVGNFAIGEPIDGRGIRRFPYSTDMNINPQTYGDLANNTEVHAIGEIWTAVMWDMHWAFVDAYGFDEDLINGTGGNNTFIQLMFDGMKLAPCLPGYLDLRDAMLQADVLNNGGVNVCMMWEVFARRGMGYLADQGTSQNAADQVENFEPLPTCIKELKIAKSVTPLVNAGDDIDVTLKVTNHKDDAVTNVVVTDELPNGVNYIAGSISGGFTANQNGGMLTIELGEMASLDEVEFTYKLSTDDNRFSIQRWIDDAETADFWFPRPVTEPDPGNNWTNTDLDSYSGEKCWAIPLVEVTSQQQLISNAPIEINGSNPVLRFYHRYDTREAYDGGIVEITKDDDPISGTWERVDGKIFRNDYPFPVAYGTFVIPNISAFSGNNGGWEASYVDLSSFANEQVYIRFNFAIDGDAGTFGESHEGWFVDDIEVMNMVNYNGDVCATSAENDFVCATAKEAGTIVESQIGVGVKDPVDRTVQLNLYPNPVKDMLNISISSTSEKDAVLSLMSLDGRELMSKAISTNTSVQMHQMDVRNVAAGFYFVKVSTAQGVRVEKVVVR